MPVRDLFLYDWIDKRASIGGGGLFGKLGFGAKNNKQIEINGPEIRGPQVDVNFESDANIGGGANNGGSVNIGGGVGSEFKAGGKAPDSHIHVEMGGIPSLAKSASSSSNSTSVTPELSSFVFYAYCRDLPGGKKIDPYLEVTGTHGVINGKTETIDNTQDPMWMDRLGFKFQGLDDVVEFQVKNDNYGKDPVIGKLVISMGSLLNEYKGMNNWGYRRCRNSRPN